jgi:steroid 5-alpha reductase family enzyme
VPQSSLLLLGTLSVCLFMALLWVFQFIRKEADIVDFGWTLSLGFLAVLYSLLGSGPLLQRSFAGLFGAIWAFRLAAHIWRRVIEPGEDGRYVELRGSWGEKAQLKFFVFFQAQALLAVLLSLSFLVPATSRNATSDLSVIIALLWFVFAIGGETLSDRQLQRWKSDPANHGRTCRAGLWQFSRHPNYFFEWLYWFTYVLLALRSDYWIFTLMSPAIILLLLLKVTGIPPTEARALKTRGEDYREYQRSTSAFFPWWRKIS